MTSDMYQSSFSSRPQPPISTLFPYTTLFRSLQLAARVEQWRRRGAAVELLSRQQVLRLTGSGQPQHLLARQQFHRGAAAPPLLHPGGELQRSEERRVGKECGYWWLWPG